MLSSVERTRGHLVTVVAGIDLGGTAINYTFLADEGGAEKWLIERLCEHPARSKEGPDVCLQQIADGLEIAAGVAGVRTGDVAVVGLDTPGPASAAGVLSARGSTNFVHPSWAGFDIRHGLEQKLGQARDVSQRRQCRRAVGTLFALRHGAARRRSPRSSAPGSAAA